MKQITLHAEAEEELRQSEQFYAERGGDGLALDFVERVRAALRLVREDPRRFPSLTKRPRVQKCRLPRFPFSIYYVERPQDIWVVAIAHAKRHPDYWTGRLR